MVVSLPVVRPSAELRLSGSDTRSFDRFSADIPHDFRLRRLRLWEGNW